MTAARTYAAIAAELRCSEREAKRLVEAAVARRMMNLQMGLERSDVTHRLVINAATRKATMKTGRALVARRFPDDLVEDDLASRTALGLSCPRRGLSVSAGPSTRKDRPIVIVTTTAPLLVEEFERLPAGDRGADLLHAEVTAAIAAARAAAVEIVFPQDLVPATADTLALYSFHTSRLTAPGYADRLAALHGRSLRSAPDLCPLLRSPEAVSDCENAAASIATPRTMQQSHAEAQAAASAEARRRYERAICEQLATAGGDLAEAARAVLAAELLSDRVTAAKAKHAHAAAAAVARAEAERQAAHEAEIAAQDAAEVERLLLEELRRHGLPASLAAAGGHFVEEQRARLVVLVPLVRRLKATTVDGVRRSRGLFTPRDLACSIGAESRADLVVLTAALDRAEGRAQTS